MTNQYINIHTHHPTGCGIELRAVGVHPWHADTECVDQIIPLLNQAQAIGEIGLDYAKSIDRVQQKDILRRQLSLAEQHNMPVVIHCVRAFEDVMNELKNYCLRAVIFHGFTGSPEQARRAVERGYFLSFGERTFASRKSIEALKITPLEKLFIETDESDITIDDIYSKIADVKSVEIDELKYRLNKNYELIFNFK